jgi:hypothetical protein
LISSVFFSGMASSAGMAGLEFDVST